MEILEIFKTFSIILISPISIALIYRLYKLPKEYSELLKSEDFIHKKRESSLKHEIKELTKENIKIETNNENLKKKLYELSTYLHTSTEFCELKNGNDNFSKCINRYITIYEILKKDGLANKSIRGDVFIGRSGAHATSIEQDFFEKIGFVSVDKKNDEIWITEKGKIFGEFYPKKFKNSIIN